MSISRCVLGRVVGVVALGCFISATLPGQLRAQSETGGGRAPPTVRRAAGCYELTIGAWSGSLPASGPQDAQRPPAWFALDSARLNLVLWRDTVYAVQPATIGPRSNRPASWPRTPAYWRPVGADSALIDWSNGYIGVTLRVVVRGDSLIGRARTFQDAHRPGEPPAPEAPIVAVRVSYPPERRGRAER